MYRYIDKHTYIHTDTWIGSLTRDYSINCIRVVQPQPRCDHPSVGYSHRVYIYVNIHTHMHIYR